MVVVGIARSQGEFNGFKFDNYKLHCLVPADESKNQDGQLCEIVKVPVAMFEASSVVIGDDISPLYDKYGRLVSLT